MRLIDADSLKTVICASVCGFQGAQVCTCGCAQILAVDNAPTIEPVRHAHWNGWTATHWTKKYDENGDPIYKEHTYYQCSECRRRTIIKSAYCPACGCKMDEVSKC